MAEADPRMSRLTLRFAEAALEAAFQHHYFRISVRQVRLAYIVIATFAVITLANEEATLRDAGYALGGLVTAPLVALGGGRAVYIYQEELLSGSAAGLSLLLLALSYWPIFRRAMGKATSVAVVLYVAVDLPIHEGIFATFPVLNRVYWTDLVWASCWC